MMRLADVNAADRAVFLEAFGGIAEHTPWVAERAIAARPYRTRGVMIDAFQAAVAGAERHEQIGLIVAHPDLAGRAAIAGELGADSASEQAGVGLDRLTPEEFRVFSDLNERYRARFGFPFIFAVKGATKHQILESFGQRIGGGHEEEFWTALAQVMRIIRFRIEDKVLDDAG